MATGIDLQAPWELHQRVALRPESFGALAYHYGTRRLSFLKHPELVRVVEELGRHERAVDALRATGIAGEHEAMFVRALGTLADTGMIVRRDAVAA
jgi:putative mycofactocin binding protein MftB